MPVTVDGLDEAIASLDGFPQRLDERLDDFLYGELASPIATATKGRARSKLGMKAAATVTVAATSYGALLSNSGGSALGHTVFAGSEFGGRKRRTSYSRRSPKGKAHIVTRRTTMQFPPFLGTSGYMLWPSIRSETDGVSRRVETLVEELIARG